MAEWRLQESAFPSSYEYHEHRERVPHLEQSWHNGRLYAAAKMIRSVKPKDVVDLGCGDGGLLSVLQTQGFECWGYDFQLSNRAGWEERGVRAQLSDVFNNDFFDVMWAELVVTTEVLEHLDDPHGAVHDIAHNAKYIVASSPADERPGDHQCDSHIWAFDWEGYEALIGEHFTIVQHRKVDWSQLILGKSRYVS